MLHNILRLPHILAQQVQMEALRVLHFDVTNQAAVPRSRLWACCAYITKTRITGAITVRPRIARKVLPREGP